MTFQAEREADEEVIGRLREMLEWPKEGDVQRLNIVKPNNALRAVWQFVSPMTRDCRADKVLECGGDGPWNMLLGVFDLDAKLADLGARATPWTEIGVAPDASRRASVNLWNHREVQLELEDVPVAYRSRSAGRCA